MYLKTTLKLYASIYNCGQVLEQKKKELLLFALTLKAIAIV